MKQVFLVLIGLLIVGLAEAQEQEVLENNPPSVKWQQVKTPNFKVLYPVGFDEQAFRVANTLEHIRDAEAKSLGVLPKRISIILQNQSSVSNGFVSLIPRRSEFYTMPTQDYNFGGTVDWLSQLAAHEYRHVVQFERANVGFNKALYYMFGPATLSAMAITAVPKWYWEGDAVATETAFTHSGRGRIPNFGLLFRTNLMEGRTFNYHKQYLLSYKNEIPDHYVLGYHMIAYLRKRTGDPDIWGRIGKRAWSVPFIPFTFSNAIKRESGLYVTQLYREMASDLRKTWEEQQRSLQLTSFKTVSKRKTKAYTNYKFPQPLPDGSVLATKSGIGDILQYVILKDDKECTVFTPGIVNETGMLSTAVTKVVWNEFRFDPRWLVKSYSVLKVYDVATKQSSIIKYNTRYAGAALSPDAEKIVTVESSVRYETTVLVLNVASGEILKRFKNPDNAFYSMARWSDDGKRIVALKTKDGFRSVVAMDLESEKEAVLIPPSRENIGYPVLTNNYLLYNSPISGIDNVYALDLSSQKRLQVTSSKYGAYNPALSADGKTLYYNDQSRDGLDVVSVPYDPAQWKAFEVKENPEDLYMALAEQEHRQTLFDSVPTQTFESKKYSKLSGIFNPYSWGAYFNSTLTQADIGISSKDILSTVAWKAGYLYDINERTGSWGVGLSYQGWYPILDLNVKYGKRSLNEGDIFYWKIIPGDTVVAQDNLTFEWTEKTVEAGIRVPLLTTNSKYHGNVTLGNYIGLTQTSEFKNSITGDGRIITPQLPVYWNRELVDNGKLIYNQFYVSAFRLLKQSRRDINSKWGQAVSLNAYGTPYGGDYSGQQFSVYTTLYFPGLFKHHSLWGYLAFQSTKLDLLNRSSTADDYNDNGAYFFRNQIPLPRGISVSRFEQFYSYSGNYTLPLWYPDIALGPVLNIQRFRFNAFADYGYGVSFPGTSNASKMNYLSFGGELKVDINVMRFFQQFNLGIRYSYGIKPSVTNVEFLIGLVNL